MHFHFCSLLGYREGGNNYRLRSKSDVSACCNLSTPENKSRTLIEIKYSAVVARQFRLASKNEMG